MKPRIIKPKDHAEWLAEREKGIGASDVAAILGLSPWESAFSLWLKKTHQVEPEPENEAMLMGHLMEEVVVQRWQMATGEKAIKASAADIIYVHPEHDFLRATPDRVVRGRKKILECKTTVTNIDPEDLPIHWVTQVQYQMYVTGIHDADLAWIVVGRYFGYAHIEYDEEYASFIAKKVEEFWNDCVIGGKEPELTTVMDFTIKGSTPDTTIEADDEAFAQVFSLSMLNSEIAGKQGEADALKDCIKLYMGENETLVYEGTPLATWKSGARGRTFLLKKKNLDEYVEKHSVEEIRNKIDSNGN